MFKSYCCPQKVNSLIGFDSNTTNQSKRLPNNVIMYGPWNFALITHLEKVYTVETRQERGIW